MNEHDQGQVASSAAEIYEDFFVPALFGDWSAQVLDVAGAQPGHSVLDVACGTGIVAREALRRVGSGGRVVGLDINEGMLAVAEKKSGDIEWKAGTAESLPFADDEFDCVVSQFGLMFFQDRRLAIAEMMRVLRSGGSGCIAVWADLAATPGYLAVADMLRELFNPNIARSIEAPYCLGNIETLESLLLEAGVMNFEINTYPGTARFNSIDEWLYTDIKGWTLADVIDSADYEQLKIAAPHYLAQFTGSDGSVRFDAPAHLVSFYK